MHYKMHQNMEHNGKTHVVHVLQRQNFQWRCQTCSSVSKCTFIFKIHFDSLFSLSLGENRFSIPYSGGDTCRERRSSSRGLLQGNCLSLLRPELALFSPFRVTMCSFCAPLFVEGESASFNFSDVIRLPSGIFRSPRRVAK